ncbi:MAG TPA: alkaline phosphatase family protein [Mycobacteriales bacterium]|nr:alkaline phosphatase family protein [Mycobacteriales bacterium]
MPDRDVSSVRVSGRSANLERAVEALCAEQLAGIVDLVAYPEPGAVVVANSDGASRLFPDGTVAERLWGADPVAAQDPLAFATIEGERADPSPPNSRNSYPHAAVRLHSLFADPRAPDIAVVHTGRHFWPERGGHLGEHGSLGVVQSRAPLLLSGPGIAGRGLLSRAARVVDIAPTMAWLSGVDLDRLSELDGSALVDLAERGAPRVVGLLWDGANSNSLLELAGSGELPAVARLLESGCALAGGAVAEFPSVTLVNHTSALTGVGPGRHGIVHNAYFDRALDERVVPNDSGNWHRAMDWLRPGVSTVFEWVDGPTACVNDPVDRGADYSTFGLIRDSRESGGANAFRSSLPDPREDRHATQEFVADGDYAWSTQVDAAGLSQMLGLWATFAAAPRLTWWNTTLTDTGHHNGGPHSRSAHAALRDADRRLGAFLDHLDRVGGMDDTVFLLTADHGSEGADPSCRGDWDEALREAGIAFRDEAYGFLYLGV